MTGDTRMIPPPDPVARAVPDEGLVYAVDDEETDRELFVRALREAGANCRCRVFASGDELLDALIDVLRGAPPPVACFIDVKMAGMSGLDVLRWIRAQPGLRSVAVIMLSSSDAPSYLAEAMQFGAQCYAAKFPAPDQLREILRAAKCHAATASCASAFELPCNLLVGSRHVAA